MSSRIAGWYRNQRVRWRAKVLRLRRIRVRAEQKARTESLAMASIYSLQKMRGQRYCSACGAPTRPSTASKD